MKLLLFIYALLLSGQLIFAQNMPVKKLSSALEKYAGDFPKSKTFIKTDKDIYAPGEKVWFKAEVFNCLTEGPANESSLVVNTETPSIKY